jgi:hypothetical protein
VNSSGGSGRRKRVSARHQVKRLDRFVFSGVSSDGNGFGGRTSFFIGAGPKIRNLTGAPCRSRFAPDVFADALVPRASPLRALPHLPSNPARRSLPKAFPRASLPKRQLIHACADGYRFAKRHGKPKLAKLAAASKINGLASCELRFRETRSDSIHREA